MLGPAYRLIVLRNDDAAATPAMTIPIKNAGVPLTEMIPKLNVTVSWNAGGRNVFTTRLINITATKMKMAPIVAVMYRMKTSARGDAGIAAANPL